jgi:hypothetical protein
MNTQFFTDLALPFNGDSPTARDSRRHRHQGAGHSESIDFAEVYADLHVTVGS